MTARAVMVCGTSSGAGKSFLATALSRWYARQGLSVAPFKAQNMSNNARVVAAGEMGSAQYFQALAARCTPDVRMNPVLLKPERDTHSQVIVLGRRRDDLAGMEWRARAQHLWPTIRSCLDGLLAAHDVVVIEGAGSAAEINLAATDVVNMRVAEAAGAATLLVADIDRGGAFAHLYGTYQLLQSHHQALIRGFVLNKFRGDPSLLVPGPQMLEARTGVPTLAVLPLWRDHGLPEEDGLFDAESRAAGEAGIAGGDPDDAGRSCGAAGRGSDAAERSRNVAIVAYPHISNLDEFASLRRVPGLTLRWAREAPDIAAADVLVLPGSKHVAADLEWLRAGGLDAAIAAHVGADKPTLAVCGGLQMLGRDVRDPYGVEAPADGLDLLPLSTEFQSAKRYRRERHTLAALAGFWAPLSGVEFDGYEIRHGVTRATSQRGGAGRRSLVPVLAEGGGWQCGNTLALYVHGIFESPQVMRRLFGREIPVLDDTFERLADFVEAHFGSNALLDLAGLARG